MDTPEPKKESERLKLRAVDVEDLDILAAFLQDAIACVAEMAYLPNERRFVLVVSRFRWEQAVAQSGHEPVSERVNCAISVEHVSEPKYRGFHLKERSRMMPVLTATYEDNVVLFTFGGDAALRLAVDRLDLRMEDFGPSWPTHFVPAHEKSGP